MSEYLNNNVFTRTTRELVDELISTMIANPTFADQPVGFTTAADRSTIYFVRGIVEDNGSVILTRGI